MAEVEVTLTLHEALIVLEWADLLDRTIDDGWSDPKDRDLIARIENEVLTREQPVDG